MKSQGLIFVAVFMLLGSNISLAVETTDTSNKYPDYSYEFCGKDKFQGFNRKLFVFNLKLNKYILRPLNIGWASVMPKYGMDRVQNLYNNINSPVRIVSSLLQKDFKTSKQESLRFLTNTTIGLAGMYDPAKNKFKIKPRNEDMGQALAHYNLKKGPYLVLPVVRGNIRDLVGQLLDYPLRPFSYIPIAGGIATAVCNINNTTYAQPLIKKIDESYADPYEIAKQIHGFDRYIKNNNLDRDEVLQAVAPSQSLVKVSGLFVPSSLKADVELKNYNPQSPVLDSLRTSFFQDPNPKKSKWVELSVWNRTFNKKIKTSSIKFDPKLPDYKFRYVLQKTKTSPLAILYPSIGEGVNSDHSNILAKILYEEGYSVLILGSHFQWEFVKSMPDNYRPGLPQKDAVCLRKVTAKIIDNLQSKKSCSFNKRILIGTSFGALETLFIGAQEEKENTLGISNYISINPPVEMFFAQRQIDKYAQEWKEDSSDIKMRAAITAEKVVKEYENIDNTKTSASNQDKNFSMTDAEAKLIIGFIMKQKLSDLVFTLEHCTRGKKTNIYDSINKMSFYDYGEKYLFVNEAEASGGRNGDAQAAALQTRLARAFKTAEASGGQNADAQASALQIGLMQTFKTNHPRPQLEFEASLYSITPYLQNNTNYKIYHTLDDFFVNQQQLSWLKEQAKDNAVIFSNGSHLGFLYRQEFLDELKKDTALNNNAPKTKL